MLPVFIGHDNRIAIQTNVCMSSIAEKASVPVALIPLRLETLPITRRGLTTFTYARFLVPWLMGFKGRALFLDSDILVNCDVAEIFRHVENMAEDKAVYVADVQPEFERAAVMVFDNEHPHNRILTPEFIEKTDAHLHLLQWTDKIGLLPMSMNHCIGYARPRPVEDLQVLHWTMGAPLWPETADSEHAEVWHAARKRMCSVGTTWPDFMAKSVHAKIGPDGKPVPKYKVV